MKENIRFGYIDALRGFAALYVLLYHVAVVPKPRLIISPRITPFVLNGQSGVILFFVVSAFTLCNSNFKRAGREGGNTIDFYTRRIFRIVPLYYFWLIFHLMLEASQGGKRSIDQILGEVSFIFNFVPGWESGGAVWAGWTIGVEMVFYLIFPLLIYYVTNYKRAMLFLFGTIVVSMSFPFIVRFFPIPKDLLFYFLYFSFFRQLPAFAFGVLAYLIFSTFIANQSVHKEWAYVLVGGFILAYISLSYLPHGNDTSQHTLSALSAICKCSSVETSISVATIIFVFQSFLYSCLLIGLSILPWALFFNRVAVFYGTISYSVYLSHPLFVYYLAPAYQSVYSLRFPSTISYIICVCLTLSLVTLVASITYFLIEKPGIWFGNALIKGFNTRKTA